ncbi:MAG TPA: hypothetical protein H9764_03080 [Candidatus Flavonifractor merdavium]|nr:hypothetical protein [Candidatus Flavonifractor merdavium]
MWISQQGQKAQSHTGGRAEVGRVTLAGNPVGVYLDGERRELPLFGPGGYAWRPEQGQQVLVIKTGGQEEAPCVVGGLCSTELGLREGEVLLYSPKASIRVGADGVVSVTGVLKVNGKKVLTEE